MTRKSRRFGLVPLAIVLEVAIVIGAAQWFIGGGAHSVWNDVERLAGARSFAELKIICTTRR
jgi:hypothetical protein